MGNRAGFTRETMRYLDYLDAHPEVVKSQPSCASSGSVWLYKALEGRCTPEEADRAMLSIVERWEKFHIETAHSLGIDLDIEEFKRRKSSSFIPFYDVLY